MSPKILAALLSVSALAACGDKDPTGPVTAANNVVFTRASGAKVNFGNDVYAWCGDWEDESIREPSVHVIVADLAHPEGSPFWLLSAVRKDITIGQALSFPNNFIFNAPKGASLFVYDPPNEASTQEGDASGSITFDKVDCNTGGRIEFHIDAVLGSEFGDGTPVSAKGTFSSPLTVNPRTLFGN